MKNLYRGSCYECSIIVERGDGNISPSFGEKYKILCPHCHRESTVKRRIPFQRATTDFQTAKLHGLKLRKKFSRFAR